MPKPCRKLSAESLENRHLMFAPEGFLDAVDPGFITSGWALDRDSPNQAIDVQMRIDGERIEVVRAGNARPDVNAALGVPGDHGFRWQIPARYLDGQTHSVRAAGIDPQTGERVVLGSPITFANTLPQGYVDAVDPGFVIAGWAFDRDFGNGEIQLRISVDGTVVDVFNTNYVRPDINDTFGISGVHGFRWNIPSTYLDGQQHSFALEAIDPHSGNAYVLPSGVSTFQNTAPRGYFDAINDDYVVAGWAFDVDTPSESATVQIAIDGIVVANVVTDIHRADVNQAYGTSGNHGFNWQIPERFFDGLRHEVEIFVLDTANVGVNRPVDRNGMAFTGPTPNSLYLVFDGYEISRNQLQHWSADWSLSPDSCIDYDRNGVSIRPFYEGNANREEVIEKVMALVQADLGQFGIGVRRHSGPVVEGEGATTIFLGESTSCHPHIAGDIDVGNDNNTDIAFVGNEFWETENRSALALADVVLHEAGHTYGLYHVESGNSAETMGMRYSVPNDREWARDTTFLDATFPIKKNHGPNGTQNSFQEMVANFGLSQSQSPVVVLDASIPFGMEEADVDYSDLYEGYATVGDTNRDGVFDSSDLVLVFQFGHYEDTIVGNSSWEHGDWNGDGEFDSSDLVLAFNQGSYQATSIAAVDFAMFGVLESMSVGEANSKRDVEPN
ncbi:MAG: hypothetical protein R3C28_28695 [Pirellulaceae bacterium]